MSVTLVSDSHASILLLRNSVHLNLFYELNKFCVKKYSLRTVRFD